MVNINLKDISKQPNSVPAWMLAGQLACGEVLLRGLVALPFPDVLEFNN